jgi:hypothetical protein
VVLERGIGFINWVISLMDTMSQKNYNNKFNST